MLKVITQFLQQAMVLGKNRKMRRQVRRERKALYLPQTGTEIFEQTSVRRNLRTLICKSPVLKTYTLSSPLRIVKVSQFGRREDRTVQACFRGRKFSAKFSCTGFPITFSELGRRFHNALK